MNYWADVWGLLAVTTCNPRSYHAQWWSKLIAFTILPDANLPKGHFCLNSYELHLCIHVFRFARISYILPQLYKIYRKNRGSRFTWVITCKFLVLCLSFLSVCSLGRVELSMFFKSKSMKNHTTLTRCQHISSKTLCCIWNVCMTFSHLQYCTGWSM